MQTSRLLSQCSTLLAANYCRRTVIKHNHYAQRSLFAWLQTGSISSRNRSTAATDVIPPPPADELSKEYSPKIKRLVEDISALTLLEVADLNALLKRTLNIQDAPMMAMGAMPAAVAKPEEEEEEAAPKREKTSFTVKLVKFDAGKKVQLIKLMRGLVDGLNLVQAKKFVEAIPQVVKADVSKEEAEKIKEELASAGAEVEIE